MHMRERGIGNMAFIAVLVLFVIALALFFMARNERDTMEAARDAARKQAAQSRGALVKGADAYRALLEVTGIATPELEVKGDEKFPTPDSIKTAIRAYLNKLVADTAKASEARLQTKHYAVTANAGVGVQPGEPAIVTLYATAHSEDTITMRAVLDPLPGQFAFAAKVAMENNQKFHEEFARYEARIKQLNETNTQIQKTYQSDVADKLQKAEGWKQELDDTQTSLQGAVAKIDKLEADNSKTKQQAEKSVRTITREKDAWKNRAITEKTAKELAIAEDPVDGRVIGASRVLGTLWINLGTKHKLSRGTRFIVWQAGKGNTRMDIAEVRVINVQKTRAECRITRRLNRRIPPGADMNVSNPFFDPKGILRVYIYGDLTRYPSDQAARRLAASGAIVQRKLDDRVNVIVLGEPPRSGDEEGVDDEESAAAAEKKAKMDRERRLNVIMRKAISIGAIVVTEDVLATFIDF